MKKVFIRCLPSRDVCLECVCVRKTDRQRQTDRNEREGKAERDEM